MLTELRYAWRALRRAPGHFLAAVICLGVGLAISVAALSAINSLVFAEIPGIANRHGLARVLLTYEGSSEAAGVNNVRVGVARALSTSDFEAFAASHGPAFAAVAAEGPWTFPLSSARGPRSLRGAFVSGHYFDVLGTTPARGRLVSAADDEPGAAAVVVVGYDLWTLILGGRDDIIGSSLTLEGRPFTVIGVAPRRFTGILIDARSGLEGTQVWLPLHHASTFAQAPSPDAVWHNVVGRLAGSTRVSEARRTTSAAAAGIEASRPDVRRHASIVLQSHGIDARDDPGQAVGAVGLFMLLPLTVLAIACANVANLQLARATTRARELTVRIALGASRLQVMRPLTAEAAVIAVAAALVGWGAAAFGLQRMEHLFPLPLRLDGVVFAFSLLLVVGVIVASGLVPAWVTARRAAAAGLKQTPRSGGLAHARLRNSLVALQVALSLVLLFVTALALRSLGVMSAGIPGSAHEVAIARLNLAEIRATPADAGRIVRAALDRLSGDARVSAAGATDALWGSGLRYWLTTDPRGVHRHAAGGVTTPSLFTVVGARPIAGRLLGERDADTPVAVVSPELAALVAPGKGSAVGRHVRLQSGPNDPIRDVEIVGVVANPLPAPDGQTGPAVYVPMGAAVPLDVSLFFRARAQGPVFADLRRALGEIQPRLAWTWTATLQHFLYLQGEPMRYLALSFGGVGALALALAIAGLYAVMAYVVSLRTSEIGIRMALGARPFDVMSLILRQAVRLGLYGVAAGLVMALPLAFGLRAVIIGISPVDPLALLQTVGLLLASALAAAALPARRAAAVDPLEAIRDE